MSSFKPKFAANRVDTSALAYDDTAVVGRVIMGRKRAGHVSFSRGPIARKKKSIWSIGATVSRHVLEMGVIERNAHPQRQTKPTLGSGPRLTVTNAGP